MGVCCLRVGNVRPETQLVVTTVRHKRELCDAPRGGKLCTCSDAKPSGYPLIETWLCAGGLDGGCMGGMFELRGAIRVASEAT
jgi:hypothetical protein